MSYHAPNTQGSPGGMSVYTLGNQGINPEKPKDPVINMRELAQATDLQANQQGYMSTYLAGATESAKLENYLSTQMVNYTGKPIIPKSGVTTSGRRLNPTVRTATAGSSKLGSFIL